MCFTVSPFSFGHVPVAAHPPLLFPFPGGRSSLFLRRLPPSPDKGDPRSLAPQQREVLPVRRSPPAPLLFFPSASDSSDALGFRNFSARRSLGSRAISLAFRPALADEILVLFVSLVRAPP